MFPMARAGLTLLFGLGLLARTDAQPVTNAAKPLAARISSLLPRRATVSVDLQVRAPLPPAESSQFRQALTGELQKTGLEISAATQPESRIRVSVSENARGLLFIAEVWNQDAERVVMLPWSRVAAPQARPAFVLTTTPVWEQAEPILDFLVLNSGSQLIVLGSTRAASFRRDNDHWVADGEASLALAHPLPRDPRGRLELVDGNLRVFLPGTTCAGASAPQLTLSCTAKNEAFAIDTRDPGMQGRWVTGRNTMESDRSPSAFYNAAAGLFALADGKIVDRSNTPVAGTEQWASDFAAVAAPCPAAPASVVIAAMRPENQRHEQVQAFEVAGGQSIARSEPLSLAGDITALWPSDTPLQAHLVIRNSTTGNYEASRLALACAQ